MNYPGILLQEELIGLEGWARSQTDFVHRSATGTITYLDVGTTFQKDLQELVLSKTADSMQQRFAEAVADVGGDTASQHVGQFVWVLVEDNHLENVNIITSKLQGSQRIPVATVGG